MEDSAQSLFPQEAWESYQEQSRTPNVPGSAHVSHQWSPVLPPGFCLILLLDVTSGTGEASAL